MDSTGVPGKIQVTENTAKVLQQQGISCEFRGHIFVKGKSKSVPDVPTYFVQLNEYNMLVSTN